MSITNEDRYDLQAKANHVVGRKEGTTLMELLPPVGWADVASSNDASSASTIDLWASTSDLWASTNGSNASTNNLNASTIDSIGSTNNLNASTTDSIGSTRR